MSAKEQTDAPFHEAFSALKQERGLSYRDLREATEAVTPAGRGLSASHLSRLCQGLDPPSAPTIALIAKALGLSPRYFAEYRLAEARALLDERASGGLQGALRQLRRFEGAPGRQSTVSRAPTRRARRGTS
jgi:transcriptional regulator with XRE-family HTH domain